MKGWLAPLAVIVAGTLGGLAFGQLYLHPAPLPAQLAVEQRLDCPQCENVRLDTCDRPICSDMKADIARRLAAGESPDQIVAAYRTAYGSSVVAADQPGGLVAAVPWLAVLLALAALAVLARRRRGTPRVAPA
jgi:MYXO-CTERM domain-containing protein